ncbi:MAG: hypothetical protein GAK41_00855 [Burkholderia gladioli]|nr:MAG: hypothetical protein GAK41_00855 [Burkholderia gladioli]
MSAAPLEIRSDSANRTLTLRWPDDRLDALAHAALRDACPCSGRRARRLAGEPVLADAGADVRVTDVRPMGYGVQLVFDDGHDRGIFSWPFLVALSAA